MFFWGRSLFSFLLRLQPNALQPAPFPTIRLFCCNKQKVMYSHPRTLTKGMCTKCLANPSYVVLPSETFHPVRLETVI